MNSLNYRHSVLGHSCRNNTGTRLASQATLPFGLSCQANVRALRTSPSMFCCDKDTHQCEIRGNGKRKATGSLIGSERVGLRDIHHRIIRQTEWARLRDLHPTHRAPMVGDMAKRLVCKLREWVERWRTCRIRAHKKQRAVIGM